MSVSVDPIAVLREFVARVTPYDPDPGAVPVASVTVSAGSDTETVPITPHLARALAQALSAYRDPADRGSCAGCGGRRLDDNLHCVDCGRLHGILGEVISRQAARVREQAAEGRPGTVP
ncbi:hypothetical protein [Plantactinospora sp. B24E8]|uniref:hypothetical protein n=1 Tax=Plantactinospora sp. B24E8 TaxID=3153567 RepID=UPI00325EDF8F